MLYKLDKTDAAMPNINYPFYFLLTMKHLIPSMHTVDDNGLFKYLEQLFHFS